MAENPGDTRPLADRAAFGGAGWEPREGTLADDIGSIWAHCGIRDEWSPLRAVLLHRPDAGFDGGGDPDASLMLEAPDPVRAGAQHDALTALYRKHGISVHEVAPESPVDPNMVFTADTFFMTPEGAILGRPASRVRAGEERAVACRLVALGIPILATVGGSGTFEGADAMWLAPDTVILAEGLRTDREGADQVEATLHRLGVTVLRTRITTPPMHLMGALRIVGPHRAVVWGSQIGRETRSHLEAIGYAVLPLPDEEEIAEGGALNFVVVEQEQIVMAAGNPRSREFMEGHGIACEEVAVDEIYKAAGGIACMTGVLERATPVT